MDIFFFRSYCLYFYSVPIFNIVILFSDSSLIFFFFLYPTRAPSSLLRIMFIINTIIYASNRENIFEI